MFSFSLPIPKKCLFKKQLSFFLPRRLRPSENHCLLFVSYLSLFVFFLSFICLSIYFHLSVVGILYCFSPMKLPWICMLCVCLLFVFCFKSTFEANRCFDSSSAVQVMQLNFSRRPDLLKKQKKDKSCPPTETAVIQAENISNLTPSSDLLSHP